MTYAIERKKIGRKPFQIVKLSCDYCVKSYGVNDPANKCTAGIVSSGVAQGGGANYIDLETGESSADDVYVRYAVYITGGTGIGQVGRITAYSGASRRATVSANWVTQPDDTSVYDLIDRPNACYNTRATCQDTTNYSASTTAKEVYLVEQNAKFPTSLLAESGIVLPCIQSISMTEPVISLTKGLGIRSSVTAVCRDFTHHDRGLDKYVDSRDYDPATQGTFWGKFLARNKYYNGRYFTLYKGYLDANDDYDVNNFEQYLYVIENMDGPSNDSVRITAKDPLKLADDDRAKVPAPNTGKLTADITAAATTFSITPSGTGDAEYDASGTLRIDEELMTFTRVSDTFTVSRAAHGSTAATHSADGAVQQCKVYSSENVVTIVKDLFNYTSISASLLDTTNWDLEQSTWLSTNTLSNIITKPTGVNKLLAELSEQNMFYMWWDPVSMLVKLKAIAPDPAVATLTDDSNMVSGSISIKEDPSQRKSQIWVYYGVRDYTETKRENFKNLYIQVKSESETNEEYADSRVHIIESRWINSEALAIQLAGRLLALYLDNPKIATFTLDNKDDINLGDKVTVETRSMQSTDGSVRSVNMVVTEYRQLESGHTNQYKAQQFSFVGNYGFISYSQYGLVQDVTSTTMVLDTRASKWSDITLSVPTEGPDVDITGTLSGTNEWDNTSLVDCIIEMTSGAQDGFTALVTAYNKATRKITFTPPFETLPAVGDSYKVYVPEFSSAYLLLESNDALLLQDGGYLILEEAAVASASVDQKLKFAFISPDSGVFDDGTKAYTIL